jgi:hypothetical protein
VKRYIITESEIAEIWKDLDYPTEMAIQDAKQRLLSLPALPEQSEYKILMRCPACGHREMTQYPQRPEQPECEQCDTLKSDADFWRGRCRDARSRSNAECVGVRLSDGMQVRGVGEAAMIAIINVASGATPLTPNRCTYKVMVNDSVICTFEHNRNEGLGMCLFEASKAVEATRMLGMVHAVADLQKGEDS